MSSNHRPLHKSLKLGWVLALTCMAALSAQARDLPLREGLWVEVKGDFVDGVFVAGEIETLQEPDLTIKGALDAFDPATGELRFGALHVVLDRNSRIRDAENNESDRDALLAGVAIKVSLEQDEGELEIRRVQFLPQQSAGRLRLEGQIEQILSEESTVRFRMLGIEVVTTSSTGWVGILLPRRLEIDDDDERPEDGFRMGRWGRLAGEVRFDYISEVNYDLFDGLKNDVATATGRTSLEWIFPTTRRTSGMLQLKLEHEDAVTDDANTFVDPGNPDLKLGRAYLLFRGILGERGSLMVGRSRFDDERDWLYNRDLDAIRLFYDLPRFRLEASILEELVDPSFRGEDALHLLARVTYFPAEKHEISAYWLDREDSFRRESGTLRNFNPRLMGLQAVGRFKKAGIRYWAEAALARGEDGNDRLRGKAMDVGATFVLPLAKEPSITVGYAFGSGDDDATDGVNENFRQSGMESNKGKWNGVTSFKYYGELFRTELSNLHIETLGLGFLPLSDTSVDLVYHRYELDRPASELVDADLEDRNLNLIDLEVGTEWDLILGFEQLKHFEFEVDLGYFSPGAGFLGPTDPAKTIRFKAKYIF